MRRHEEILFGVGVTVLGCLGLALLLGCNTQQATAPTPVLEQELARTPDNPAFGGAPNATPEPEAQQAEGELIIQGNYGICDFSKSYGKRESLAVYRVLENGSQVPIAWYPDEAEGNLQCGIKIQADCLINYNHQPDAGDINAYGLADAFIGTIECRTPPRNPPPPDPGCNQRELAALAAEECGELTPIIDFAECTFTCDEPEPPTCNEGEVLVEGVCVPFCIAFPGDPVCAPFCEEGVAVWNVQEWVCPPPPPPGECWYEVSPNNADDKQAYCEGLGGVFISQDNSEHCFFTVPGVADCRMELQPGQSDPECLSKQDMEDWPAACVGQD